ncbi:phosphate kinase [Brevibacterium aurantiacum]|uniref:Phosphate kinase n=2 Tax=Brevibacterium aurantiacum TaxID=273384 RepID=A0A4Z0KDA7_BREAU|nr:phosphate kinase [Brevibacterium aurantiacum]
MVKSVQPSCTEDRLAEGVFSFEHDHHRPARELDALLGGKGAGLAEMTKTLQIPVPPGFTIGLGISQLYRDGGWPAGLDAVLADHLTELGNKLGRHLGDRADPLLVSVRSGAPVSMPGMLDTVLNLGLNDQTVLGLAELADDERFAWNSYRRFAEMFATIVRNIPAEAIPRAENTSSAEIARENLANLRDVVIRESGEDIPQDPHIQLRETVEAVFRSWDSPRAVAYREHENIDPNIGTAVSIQSMVFGNRGTDSGTGVVFTRDPNTGDPTLYGDYLPNAQGEDVVAGIAHTMEISALSASQPRVAEQLEAVLRKLEVHYRDMCDVEFTVEQGKLWVLQTRVGKRGARAAARIAADMVEDPEIALTTAEAVERVPNNLLDRAKQDCAASGHRKSDKDVIATGLPASPGRVSGRLVLTAEAAVESEDDVILARNETSPEDVMGMSASVGVLTTCGGLVSHAAVVARGWGIPAVVGAKELTVDDRGLFADGQVQVSPGQTVTIDGGTGEVWVGGMETDEATETDYPREIILLEQWRSELARE